MLTISAPGKLMLFGEHAVVYGQPCIVTAIDVRLRVNIEETKKKGVVFDTPGNGNQAFIAKAVEVASSVWSLPKGLRISTQSPFSGRYGFGSSSAVTVATLHALSTICGVAISKKELFDLAYRVVIDVQRMGSGFDVASAIWGGTIFFQNKGETIETLKHPPLSLLVAYTGQKANTVDIVRGVATAKEKDSTKYTKLFVDIGKLVTQAARVYKKGEYETLGRLMDRNQEYLREMGVSTPGLEKLILAAKKAGAWGAKLSGAGGGDCMIALVPPGQTVEVIFAIRESGGEVVPVLIDASGVDSATISPPVEKKYSRKRSIL